MGSGDMLVVPLTMADMTAASGEPWSLPSLTGGGPIKYQAKPKQARNHKRAQEPLIFLPVEQGVTDRGREKDARYVTRSVPIQPQRHEKDADRGSNSAPMETSRRHTNHDRQPRSRLPRLPKINNLINEPTQQRVHGTSTVTEAGRKDRGGKRWASSWADARANSSGHGESKGTPDNLSHPSSSSNESWKARPPLDVTVDSHSSVKSSSPRISNGATIKSRKETDDKVPLNGTGVKRTEVSEPKTRTIPAVSSKSSSLKQSKVTDDILEDREYSWDVYSKTDKTLLTRSKSSAVLSMKPRNVSRQASEIASAYSSPSTHKKEVPLVRVSAVSRGSNSTSTTLRSKSNLPQKKRFRKPVIITRKSVVKQKSLQSVYGSTSFKVQRHVRVLQKMEQVQRKDEEESDRAIKEKEKSRMESIVRQRMALKRVRDRFDEEQVRRFRRQYVSWKSVEEDRLNRSSEVYGLPDFIYEDRYERTLKKIPETQAAAPSTSKKTTKKFKKYATWMTNIKRFEKILNPKMGANMEEVFKTTQKAIVEGIDTVKLGSGDSTRAKKVNVKRLIGSAKKLLSVTENMDDISEVSSYQEDDDDDSSLDLSDDEDDQ